MTIHCRACGTPIPATRVPWHADDHDGADLVGECPGCGRFCREVE